MYLDLKTGYTCNNHCVHCVVEPDRVSMESAGLRHEATTTEVLAQIEAARATGAGTVVLTGGEVTLRLDFMQLVEAALAADLRVLIQTNGRRIAQHSAYLSPIPDRLVFAIAVHGPDAASHDAITRVTGSFDQTMLGIEALHRDGHPVIGKIVMSRLNTNCTLRTLEHLSCAGVNRFIIAFPHALGFPDELFTAVVPRYSEVAGELIECARSADRAGWSLELETVPCCVIASAPEAWLRSRDVRVAVSEIDAAFIRAPGHESLLEWETERRRVKWKGAVCERCLLDRACEGPWIEYVEKYGHEEFHAVEDPTLLAVLA